MFYLDITFHITEFVAEFLDLKIQILPMSYLLDTKKYIHIYINDFLKDTVKVRMPRDSRAFNFTGKYPVV